MAPLKGIQMNVYNYTIPMLIFTSLGILAMVFGLLLKREDKKKGFGLELPNIKSGLGIIALILLGSVIPGNAGAQTAPTEISVRDQNSIAGKNSPMAEKRIRSWAHHQELKNSSQFKDLTWRAVGPEYIGGRIQSIACHPKNPFTIYTGVGSGNLWKTEDNGITWTPVFEHESSFAIGCVTIAPSDPEIVWVGTGEVLMARSSYSGTGVFKSTDRGETWNKMNTNDIPTAINSDYCIVMVSPDNENEIYLLGNKLIRSTDGGKTYTPTGETILHLLPHDIRVMHLDMHAMWIDPVQPDHLLLGNDGGLYSSYDRGTTWLHLNNMPIGEFYAVSVDNATPYNIYGGTQDNAAVFGPSDYVITDRFTQYGVVSPWKNVYLDQWGGGDSYFTEPDPTDADVIYYEHQFGEIIRKNMKTGETAHIQPEAGKDEPPLRFNWMSPYLISAFDPNVLYFGTQKLMKSYDRGDHWIAISPDLTTDPGPEKQGNVPFGTLTTISESPLRQGLLYAGTDDGNMHVTLDDGKTWTKIDQSLPDKWLTRVRASRHAVSTVYACLTGYREDDIESYLYVSDDNGQSWNPIKGNLPAESVNVIVEDPRSPDILYIGTDLGVYVTLNRGKGWTSLCNNLPTAAVYDLALQSRDLELVAATHGRSIFILNIKDIVKK